MQTLLKKITPQSLKEAKEILLSGGAVAFPTETVYGLGADARSDDAVEQIFRIKGRPSDNPLIVHVHSDYDLSRLVKNVKPYVQALREAFLPGPLTLVFESRGTVSPKVSCGWKRSLSACLRTRGHRNCCNTWICRSRRLPPIFPST